MFLLRKLPILIWIIWAITTSSTPRIRITALCITTIIRTVARWVGWKLRSHSQNNEGYSVQVQWFDLLIIFMKRTICSFIWTVSWPCLLHFRIFLLIGWFRNVILLLSHSVTLISPELVQVFASIDQIVSILPQDFLACMKVTTLAQRLVCLQYLLKSQVISWSRTIGHGSHWRLLANCLRHHAALLLYLLLPSGGQGHSLGVSMSINSRTFNQSTRSSAKAPLPFIRFTARVHGKWKHLLRSTSSLLYWSISFTWGAQGLYLMLHHLIHILELSV